MALPKALAVVATATEGHVPTMLALDDFIGHVATFDTVASLDAWIEAKPEEDRLLDTPLPLAEAIREAGYILAARAALHVKDINRTTQS